MEVKPVVLTGKHVRLEPLAEKHIPGLAEIGVRQQDRELGPSAHPDDIEHARQP